LPDGARKELVAMKEQMDRTVQGYDKKFNEILNERSVLIHDNDHLHGKLSQISRNLWNSDLEVAALQNGYKHSVEELEKMDQDHKTGIDN